MPKRIPEFDPTLTSTGNLILDVSPGCIIELWNESAVTLEFETTYGDFYVLPAGFLHRFRFGYTVSELQWITLFTIQGTAPTVSRIYGLKYSPTESQEITIGDPVAIPRFININGGVVSVAQSSSIVNDNNPDATIIIESKPSLATGSLILVYNDGTMSWYTRKNSGPYLMMRILPPSTPLLNDSYVIIGGDNIQISPSAAGWFRMLKAEFRQSHIIEALNDPTKYTLFEADANGDVTITPPTKTTLAISLVLSFLTAGSIPFIGVNGVVSEDNTNLFWLASSKNLYIGTNNPASGAKLVTVATDASTATVTRVAILGHNSSGVPAAGFGGSLTFTLHSSTTTDRLASLIQTTWEDATHATRRPRLTMSVYNAAGAALEGMRIATDGTVAQVGFLGAAAVARQTLAAAATDLPTVITLANSLRTALINLGLGV